MAYPYNVTYYPVPGYYLTPQPVTASLPRDYIPLPYLHPPQGIVSPISHHYHSPARLQHLIFYSKHPRVQFNLADPRPYPTLPTGGHLSTTDRDAPATDPPCSRMRIVCEILPWYIDIESKSGVITVGYLFEQLHQSLRWPVARSEWLIADRKKQHRVNSAFYDRQRTFTGKQKHKGLIWVDWLENQTWFQGLTNDPAVVKEILGDQAEEVPQTWVMVVGPR